MPTQLPQRPQEPRPAGEPTPAGEPPPRVRFWQKEKSILGFYIELGKLFWDCCNFFVLKMLYLFLKGLWLLIRNIGPPPPKDGE